MIIWTRQFLFLFPISRTMSILLPWWKVRAPSEAGNINTNKCPSYTSKHSTKGLSNCSPKTNSVPIHCSLTETFPLPHLLSIYLINNLSSKSLIYFESTCLLKTKC
jgi:hypothetical protein